MTRVLSAVVLFGLSACGGAQPTPVESKTDEAEPAEPEAKSPDEKTTQKKRKSFAETAPVVGSAAPEFELADLAGEKVALASVIPRGPTVLVFGSYT